MNRMGSLRIGPSKFYLTHDFGHELHGGRENPENGKMVRNGDLIT